MKKLRESEEQLKEDKRILENFINEREETER